MAATVSFRLNRPKDKNGNLKTSPVGILVSYYRNGLEVELSARQKVVPAQWLGSRVSKEAPRAKQINKVLSDKENKLLNLEFDYPGISKVEEERLARAIMKGESLKKQSQDQTQKKTSLFTVGRFLVQCKRELDPKTVIRYKVLWGALSRFMKGDRLDFSAFNMGFHDRFKNFLYDTPNPLYTGFHLEYNSINNCYDVVPGHDPGNTIGLFDDTVFKYLTILKTACDWADERGYVVHKSYKTWEIIKREYPPISLKKHELENIESMPPLGKMVHLILDKDKKPHSKIDIDLDYCRDYISFASRTGPRISDVKSFNPHDINEDVWKVTQKKGNRTKIKVVQIPLVGFSSPAKLILEKYNYSLPKIPESNLRIGIKEVCKRAKINEPMFIERWAGNKKIRISGEKWEFIGPHTCKANYITLLAAEGVHVKAISDLTGTSIKTIERHYLGKTDIDTLKTLLEKAGETKAIMRKAQ